MMDLPSPYSTGHFIASQRPVSGSEEDVITQYNTRPRFETDAVVNRNMIQYVAIQHAGGPDDRSPLYIIMPMLF